MTPVRVLCNADWFEGRTIGGRGVAVRRLVESGWAAPLRNLVAWWRSDVAVFNIATRQLMVLAAARALLPFSRCRLVLVDTILNRPQTWRQRLRVRLMRRLLHEVDLFILYFRDTEALQRVYAIPAAKIRYVPFKVNDFANVVKAPVTDAGYILACGRSKRDYVTFARAMDGLPYRATILVPKAEEARVHGTNSDLAGLPPNVAVVQDDGSSRSWIEWISRASFVVLPILPDTLAPSGIGTYLAAMALGKCVVITEGLATRGLLDSSTAVLVPPADAAALRAAVVRVADDRAFRERVAAAGRDYARGLGDVSRLAGDIIHEVEVLLTGRETANGTSLHLGGSAR
ncbi:MAG: glycosyltransferase [Gemmatimonadales bacterium]